MHGIRVRLAVTLVALVALTAAVLGVGAYLFMDVSLHDRLLHDARTQAISDLTELAPERLAGAADPTTADVVASRLPESLDRRGIGAIIVASDGEAVTPGLAGVRAALPADLAVSAGSSDLRYAWTTIAARPVLVVAGRMQPSGPLFYFVHDATSIEDALAQLRVALLIGALALAVIALVAARRIARGVLAPVEVAGRAAARIEAGDLGARVPVTSRDEFGTWAMRFNAMADTLADTIARLEAAQAQNRRFVADVSHELRTPLTALVAEASILREHLADLPAGARRAGELLVDDVSRLRTLVEELMELSRFDAAVEQPLLQPIDLGRLIRSIATARGPDARLSLPAQPVAVETDPGRIERIVGNLLDNVAEHAPGSVAEVELREADGVVVLTVADRGPGVEPSRLAHVFDRFYKADPSHRGGSSGLGLAIAREHAALLGGELQAVNREGGGLLVQLRLPVTGLLPGGDLPASGGPDRVRQNEAAQEPVP